jgi:NAD(P)-dependent dehydrogenase (short-subunit alcohol dehydrogenase family)
MELSGKNVIVTGSTGSLGSELVKALAEAGCNCVCHYHKNKEKAEKIVSDIKAMSLKAIAIKADLTEPQQIDGLFEQALNYFCTVQASRYAPVQILINSASVFERTPLQEISVGQSRRILDVNLTACILTAKAFAQRVSNGWGDKDAPAGKIINICDVAATKPWVQYSLYCASKAGLIGATKALAKELAPSILVNSLAPGIATWPTEMTSEEEKRQLGFIPMRRFAETREIAAAMIFLLQNDYITGQVLNVCGGRGI